MTLTRTFHVQQGCLEPREQHCKGFYLYNDLPRVLRQHLIWFFAVYCCLEPLGQHCTRFLPVQCCPKSIKTTLYRICFSVQCCLEPQGQEYIHYLPVQCCPRSIKTTLNMIFVPYNLVFFSVLAQNLCAILMQHLQQLIVFQEINQSKIKIIDAVQKTMCWAFPVQCCLESLGQHYTRLLLPAQCWPMSNRQLLWRK